MKIFTIAAFLVALPLTVRAQDKSPLPPFPQRTETDIYEQLGRCNADVRDLLKWIDAFKAELAKKDAEIQRLKKPDPPPAESEPAK